MGVNNQQQRWLMSNGENQGKQEDDQMIAAMVGGMDTVHGKHPKVNGGEGGP